MLKTTWLMLATISMITSIRDDVPGRSSCSLLLDTSPWWKHGAGIDGQIFKIVPPGICIRAAKSGHHLSSRLRGGDSGMFGASMNAMMDEEESDEHEEESEELSSSELYHDHCLVRAKDEVTLEYANVLLRKICLPPKDFQSKQDLHSLTNILYYLLSLASQINRKSKSVPINIEEREFYSKCQSLRTSFESKNGTRFEENSILLFQSQHSKAGIPKESNVLTSQNSTRKPLTTQLTAAQIDRARRKLLIDAFEDPQHKQNDTTMEQHNTLLDQISVSLNKFKMSAKSNLDDIMRSSELVDSVKQGMAGYAPYLNNVRREVEESLKELRQRDRALFFVNTFGLAGMLFLLYSIMKWKG